jgi:protein HOOK3
MDDLANDVSGMSMSGAHAKSLAEAKEKAMRMDVANQKLREQMEDMKRKHEAELEQAAAAAESAAAAAASAAATSEAAAAAKQQGQPAVSSLEIARLKGQIAQLEKDLKQKEAEKAKLGSDKEKLEAYTKKTLSKFQEKYLVALQECKAKLKEKHDKIEALEMRSASEKTAQKREERLLSSTIYELGLAIMQQRLKDR